MRERDNPTRGLAKSKRYRVFYDGFLPRAPIGAPYYHPRGRIFLRSNAIARNRAEPGLARRASEGEVNLLLLSIAEQLIDL